MDQSGHDLITMLQKTTFQLKTAEDRISALEIAIKQWQDRAALAKHSFFKTFKTRSNVALIARATLARITRF